MIILKKWTVFLLDRFFQLNSLEEVVSCLGFFAPRYDLTCADFQARLLIIIGAILIVGGGMLNELWKSDN